jgi:hypothetical protein
MGLDEMNDMTTDQQSELLPIEGHILHASAFPRDEEETITFHLLYSESSDVSNYVGKQFEVGKADAETLAKRILQIIAEPDTQTAWENIAKDVDEEDHDALSRRPYLLHKSLPSKDS